MPDTGLAAPASTDELYLGYGDDIAHARPLLTGDVLTDVRIDVDDHDGTVMIVAHPCSMRGAGGRLLPRIAVAPVRPYQPVPFQNWSSGHFKVMPLPGMGGPNDQQPRAVHLLELTAVRSEQLIPVRRILALKDRGIHVLQQRLVYCLTRVEVGLDKLQEQTAHVLLEAELQEEWVEELADDLNPESLLAASEAFTTYMDGGYRNALKDPTRRSDTLRAVRAEIRRQRNLRSDDERTPQAR
jgi:hypothetical protein